MGMEADSPTVVIGIGGAGMQMLNTLNDVIEEDGYDRDDFLLLGIDSREVAEVDVEDWNRKTSVISWKDEQSWEEKQETYRYLDANDSPPAEEGGVERDRTLARALVDDNENVLTLISNLTSNIESFAENETNVDIWVLNALGGGTGSGTFPFVFGLLNALSRAEFSPKVSLYGLGTLPTFEVDPDQEFIPSGLDADAVPNSFAALTELRELLDVTTTSNGYERDIELEIDADQVPLFSHAGARLPLSQDTFDTYYLLGIDEEEIAQNKESYSNQIERTAAYTVLAHAATDENFVLDPYPKLERTLFTTDGVEYAFPFKDAAVHVKREIMRRQLENDTENLNDLTDLFERQQQFVDEVTTAEHADFEVEDEAIGTLVSYCERVADELDGLEHYDYDSLVEAATERLSESDDSVGVLGDRLGGVETLREGITPDHRPPSPSAFLSSEADDGLAERTSPSDLVLEFLFFSVLRRDVVTKKKSARNRFESRLKKVRNHDEVDGELPTATREDYEFFDDPVDRWEEVLSPFVDERIRELEDGGIVFSKEEEAADLADKQGDVDDMLDRYEALSDVESTLGELITGRRNRLRNLVEWYDDQRQAIGGTLERIEEELESVQTRMETTSERLVGGGNGKFKSIPVEKPEELVTNYFQSSDEGLLAVVERLVEQYDVGDAEDPDIAAIEQHLRSELTIQDLTESGAVDGDHLDEEIRSLVSHLDEQVADDGSTQNTLLLPITHDDDDWLEAISAGGYDDVIQGLSASAGNAKISGAHDQVGTGVRGTIRFLFINADVQLDHASEYRTMREWYENGRLVDVFDFDANDPAEAVNWAYPELVDLDTGIPIDEGN